MKLPMLKKSLLSVWFALVILTVLFLCGSAAAADALPAEVSDLFQSALPAHTIARSHLCGNTAAAVLTDGQTQTLCVAEQRSGAWELVVCNPKALRQDVPVAGLLLDTDDVLFWSYNLSGSAVETIHAFRSGGQWRVMDVISSEAYENGNTSESHLYCQEGRLDYVTYFCDENGNVLSSDAYAPVPARWLDELLPLTAFDDSCFPKPNQYYTHSWLSPQATAEAAAELFPGDTFLGGCARKEHLEFFLQTPDGQRIMAVCTHHQKDGWRIIRSTSLPEGTAYGYENFSSSLVTGDLLVNVGMVDENTCGISYIYNMSDMASGETMFRLGKNWVSDGSTLGYENRFGDHPWADISRMDWNSLPHTFEEALAVMDTSGWAVVSNPNPDDRLHLRTAPDREATSLGKYYNGTPVRVLETSGDWVKVDIFGITGWMMKRYLAFGDAGHTVEAVFPARVPADTGKIRYVYSQPDQTARPVASFQERQQDLLVLAVIGEEWYHVWFPQDNVTGYVPVNDWKEGNG